MKTHSLLAVMAVMVSQFLSLSLSTNHAADLRQQARELKQQLQDQIMPYWYDTGLDKTHGGYLLADDARKKAAPATVKQIVSQSRMIWTFSHVVRKKLEGGKRDYLGAARNGYRFLIQHFLDPVNGGYFWTTDLAGKPVNDRKIVYGESFVIYALVEYYRASGERAALNKALDLYRVLQKRAYDAKNGGWREHFERDWKPLQPRDPAAQVEVAGLKSANTHLHLMEALTELYEATRDPDVRKSLDEAAKINRTYFYPPEAGQSCFHRQPDWSPVTDPGSAGLSYGHNVEFAWLLIRAETVLGLDPSWHHFEAHLNHALRFGYDHERGGLYQLGVGDQPATKTDKVWWVEAEMMAALTDALRNKPNPEYQKALEQLVVFVRKYQADPRDGVWYDTVAADGALLNSAKAHLWKANYHDVRALVKFIEAYAR